MRRNMRYFNVMILGQAQSRYEVAVQTFLKLCLRGSKDTAAAAALALVGRNEWALKTNKIMVEVQPVNRKSAQKLSKLRLSFFLSLSGVGELDKAGIDKMRLTHKAKAAQPVCLPTDREILVPGEEHPDIRRLKVLENKGVAIIANPTSWWHRSKFLSN
ncbi:hypothetical protein C4D60_Mb02t16140 [Musa balbisiana]|uniref:Uncharacterized protein n=1 Tax=Musa balbisiana TaxID=52838 RepID=A0A4S8IB32_MUSBA|nr:hypothetical protein C4D60_Mb02t16140 [Musa balbisiana]